MRLPSCLTLLLGLASGRSVDAAPTPHLLADRIVDDRRSIFLVVEEATSCVPASQIVVAPPFTPTVRTRCVLAIAGPLDSVPQLSVARQPIVLDLAPLAPDAPPKPTSTPQQQGWSLEIIATRAPLPVGHRAIGAYLLVTKNGKPTSDVDLNVSVEGARPRALRWTSQGVAAIDLLVPTWRPTVEVVAQRAGIDAVRATVEVDPGPPIAVELTLPATIHAGDELVLSPRIRTSEGVPVPQDRVRVAIVGCARSRRGFICPAGETVVTVAVERDGVWIPIDRQAFVVDTRREPPSISIAVAAVPVPRAMQWELGVRGGRAAGGWTSGLRLGVVRRFTPRTGLDVGLGWRLFQRTLATQLPLPADPTLVEHELALLGGMRHQPSPGLPLVVRGVLGAAVIRTSLDREAAGDLGLRALVALVAGVRVARGDYLLGVDLGARLASDLVVAGFPVGAGELYLEVSLALR